MRTRSLMILRVAIVGLAVALAFAGPVEAQDFSWRHRKDRYEGIITSRDAAGGYLSLLGVHVEGIRRSALSASVLNVSFWLPESRSVRIKVWEPDTNYWMIPDRREFPAGFQSFAWPADAVVKPLNLDTGRLRVLVTNLEETLYFPAGINTEPAELMEGRYQFVFESRGAVELRGTISRQTDVGPEAVRRFDVIEDYPGVIKVTWDGREATGARIPAGVFNLRLEGFVYLSETDEETVLNIRFVHRSPIGGG